TDAAFTFRREFQKFFNELALLIEQLFRAITLEPLFKDFQMPTLGIHVCNRHLMGSPGTFDRLAIHDLWSSPTLWSPQDDHGPDSASPSPTTQQATRSGLSKTAP